VVAELVVSESVFFRVRLGSSAQEHWTVGILPRVQFCTVFIHVTASQRVQCYCALDPSHSLFFRGGKKALSLKIIILDWTNMSGHG
jgi:hypothetical protein